VDECKPLGGGLVTLAHAQAQCDGRVSNHIFNTPASPLTRRSRRAIARVFVGLVFTAMQLVELPELFRHARQLVLAEVHLLQRDEQPEPRRHWANTTSTRPQK
jgi:hypothetical protein